MPIFDLATPTGVFLHWGWLLVTRANGLVYVLVAAMFFLGILVPLPKGRTRRAASPMPAAQAEAPARASGQAPAGPQSDRS